MSASTTAAPARTGPSFARVLAAEWTKFLGLRSTTVIAVVTVIATGGLTHLFASAASGDPGFVPTRELTAALPLAFIGPLVLGVLVGTGEFSTGTFRSTFAAVPRRLPVLAAQVVVTACSVLGIAVLTVAAAVLGILPAAASRDLDVDLLGAGVPQILLGSVSSFVGTALFGLAVGALLRRPVPALVTVFGVLLVLPIVLSLAVDLAADPLAASVSGTTPPGTAAVNTVETFTPVGAGGVLTTPDGSGLDGAPELGAWGATLVLAAWVALPLAAAAHRLRRRDLV